MKEKLLGILIFVGIIVSLLGVSWGATCLVTYLIFMCFDLTFKLSTATGIWLLLLLVWGLIKSIRNSKN